ncbi:unnamed protein product, partial [Amoebophrya sp. A25]|eukprot:GSA25T00005102001.1
MGIDIKDRDFYTATQAEYHTREGMASIEQSAAEVAAATEAYEVEKSEAGNAESSAIGAVAEKKYDVVEPEETAQPSSRHVQGDEEVITYPSPEEQDQEEQQAQQSEAAAPVNSRVSAKQESTAEGEVDVQDPASEVLSKKSDRQKSHQGVDEPAPDASAVSPAMPVSQISSAGGSGVAHPYAHEPSSVATTASEDQRLHERQLDQQEYAFAAATDLGPHADAGARRIRDTALSVASPVDNPIDAQLAADRW